MCLIVDKPSDAAWDIAVLTNALEDNPDGWGIMYHPGSGRKVRVQRGLDPSRFWDSLRSVPSNAHVTLHFRWATHGTVGLHNTHPFGYGSGHLVHNGVLNVTIRDKRRSDTAHFASNMKRVLRERPHLFGTPEFVTALEKAVGPYNKLVFLSNRGERMFVNEGGGTRADGVWYSNLNSHHIGRRWAPPTVRNATDHIGDDVGDDPLDTWYRTSSGVWVDLSRPRTWGEKLDPWTLDATDLDTLGIDYPEALWSDEFWPERYFGGAPDEWDEPTEDLDRPLVYPRVSFAHRIR